MGALMTNKVCLFVFSKNMDSIINFLKDFHECAYKAIDRRELVDSINKFTSKSLCLVLPAVDFGDDADVLLPVVDWIKERLNRKKKKEKKASSIKRRNKKASIKKKMYKVESDTNEDKSSLGGIAEVSHTPVDNDPFKRTGCLFGGLFKEMKIRYQKYKSDITDGMNMQCFISFIFIFTVCIAPALTFGGILGNF